MGGFQTQNAWYTLIHGTSDDNVHFQNAAMMEKTLVQADVDFDDFFYADQAHSINIGNAKVHVYRQIDHRLSSCLGKLTSYYPESYLDVEKNKVQRQVLEIIENAEGEVDRNNLICPL